ncbi:hypothetical protein RCH23_003427, partial [Cryobacterium sp. CAN_C3]|uniref:hypothetical protein n=1 Tax=unclassified Cryobacterium TaxID=2649013 RepID=UPI002E01EBB0|nr:hypothetical protein [Cryobacterium sp. CAN_C3]
LFDDHGGSINPDGNYDDANRHCSNSYDAQTWMVGPSAAMAGPSAVPITFPAAETRTASPELLAVAIGATADESGSTTAARINPSRTSNER